MPDPVIYGAAYSTYTRSVRLALEEKDIPYRLQDVDIVSGQAQSPEHLKRHPFGKVPAFEHDGFALHETMAIQRYIDETFPQPPLQPTDIRERARMTQIMSIIDNYGYPAMITAIVMQRVVTPMLGGVPDETVIANAMPTAETTVTALERLLGDQLYLAGNALSIADLHLIPVYDYVSQTPEGKQLLHKAHGLERWWASVSTRDSVRNTRPALG